MRYIYNGRTYEPETWDEIFEDETLAFQPKKARNPREAKRREWRANESKFTKKAKGNADVSE